MKQTVLKFPLTSLINEPLREKLIELYKEESKKCITGDVFEKRLFDNIIAHRHHRSLQYSSYFE